MLADLGPLRLGQVRKTSNRRRLKEHRVDRVELTGLQAERQPKGLVSRFDFVSAVAELSRQALELFDSFAEADELPPLRLPFELQEPAPGGELLGVLPLILGEPRPKARERLVGAEAPGEGIVDLPRCLLDPGATSQQV